VNKSPNKEYKKLICENRKAYHNYTFIQKIEAGVRLVGSEVKSAWEGRANLADAYALIEKGEVFMHNSQIEQYGPAGVQNHEPRRTRKLLLHRDEIDRLEGKLHEKGLSLIPLSLYFRNGKIKVELGLGRGKREYEKDETRKERDVTRDIQRSVRSIEVKKRYNDQ
jgi:SsrA-binding protein